MQHARTAGGASRSDQRVFLSESCRLLATIARLDNARTPLETTFFGARSRRGWLGFCAALLIVTSFPPRDAGAAEPDPRFFVRSRTVVDAYQLRRLDGGVAQTRAVAQRLDIAATADGVLAVFGGSFLFDEGLRSRPASAEARERQLQPVLHRASIRWTAGPNTTIEAGRHDIISSPVGLARIDGVSGRARFDVAEFGLHVGLRPDDGILRIDDAAYLPDTDRADRKAFGDHTALMEGSLRVADRIGEARLAVRREAAIDGEFEDGTRLGIGLRAGTMENTYAATRLRMHAESGSLERYDATAITRRSALSVQLTARGAEAVFPLDSIFSVFPQTRYDEQALRLSFGDDVVVETSALARSSGVTGAPKSERLRTAGGALSVSDRHPSGTFWRASARFAQGARGSELRARGTVATTPARGPGWTATYVLSRRIQRVTGLERHRLAAFARVGATWRIDDWAELSIATDTGWSQRDRASVRVFGTADISLQGGRS